MTNDKCIMCAVTRASVRSLMLAVAISTLALAVTDLRSSSAMAQAGGGAGNGGTAPSSAGGATGAEFGSTSATGAQPSSPSMEPSQRQPDTKSQPEINTPVGGGGVSAAAGNGVEDELTPTDNSATSGSSGRTINSISEEPDRVKRGGGAAGANLGECLALWDSNTHMSKEQWKITCERLGG